MQLNPLICISSALLRLSKGPHLEVLGLWGQSLVHCGTGKHQLLLGHLLSCYWPGGLHRLGKQPRVGSRGGEQDTWGHIPHFIVLSPVTPVLTKITARGPEMEHMSSQNPPWSHYPRYPWASTPLYMGGAALGDGHPCLPLQPGCRAESCVYGEVWKSTIL